MTTIKGFINHTNQIEESEKVGSPNKGLNVDDTELLIAYLCNLQPPMWTVLGGRRDTGKTRLLEACAASNTGPIKSHETLVVTLPDEEPRPRRREEQASDIAQTIFRAIHQATYETSGGTRGWFRRRQLSAGELSRQLTFADVFGRVRRRINDLGIRRLILDNGHYLRHDTYAFQKLFDLRKVLRLPLVLLLGVRLEQDGQVAQIFNLNMDKVEDAKATLVQPVALFGLREDDFRHVLQHVFFDLRGLPDKTFEQQEESLLKEIWPVTWKGNWDRIEMFAAHLDAELRAANAQPRTVERPGIIRLAMVRRVIAKMQPGTPQ